MSDILEIIKYRRSIFPKMFTGQPVDDSIVEQMLEAAHWAPTHKLTEPWSFKVFTGNGLKKLADFQSSLYKQLAEQKGTFDEVLFAKLQNNPLKCTHAISIGVKVSGKVPEIEETNAVAAAVQNMQLLAAQNNVGCYWGSGGVTYYEEAKSFFDLEQQDKLMGFLYLGHYEHSKREGKRSPLEDHVSWVREA